MARLCSPPGKNRAATASTMPIAAEPFPDTPAPETWLIATSGGGATTIIPLKSILRCMIKGLNLVQHNDNACGDSHAFLFLALLLQKSQDRVEELEAVLLEQKEVRGI